MPDALPFFENFEAALQKLIEFQKIYDGSEIHRAGIIQAFEFTFEQCWKALQKRADQEGLNLTSPKKNIEWAMANGWIPTPMESTWLEILNDHNLTSHTYRDQTAQEVSQRILKTHVAEFTSILAKMKLA